MPRRCRPKASETVVDAETGFVYLRARYYDPATGQFISRDPLTAMTGSPYAYVDGNPLNMIDPLGLFGWKDVRKAFSLRTASNVLKVTALVAAGAALVVSAPGTLTALTVVSFGASLGATAIDCRGGFNFACGVSAATTAFGGAAGAIGVGAAWGYLGRLAPGVGLAVKAGTDFLGYLSTLMSFVPAEASERSPEMC